MRWILSAFLFAPTFCLAAGGISDAPPPKPVHTCDGAQIYDEKTKSCVDARDSSQDIETIYQTVRQLAYAGRYADAQTLARALPERHTGRLTYMGFTFRKLGDMDSAMAFYRAAISEDPKNNLARSYMGQGLVESGDIVGALVQLRAIQKQGGAETWAETALRTAIETGTTYSY